VEINPLILSGATQMLVLHDLYYNVGFRLLFIQPTSKDEKDLVNSPLKKMKMKTIKFIALALLTMSTVVSCKKDEKISPSNSSAVLQDATWKVTLFSEDGVNETNYFTGYSFDFQDGGIVKATSGSNTVNGTWVTREDSGKTKLDLNFDYINNFDELDEDWEILSQNSTKMELKHVSGGDGSIDLLTFEKN